MGDGGGVISTDFLQDGGNIDGSFEIDGEFGWADGSWSTTNPSATTVIKSDGVLYIEDTTSFYENRDITNYGTVNWTGGTLLTNANGSFVNFGSFNDQSDSDHNLSETSGDSTFTNDGTYLKTGAGTTRIDQTFDNGSPVTLDVRNGVLELNGGGTNGSSGAVVVKNDGLIRFTDNYTIENAANLSTESLSGDYGYELESGELELNGQLNVDFLQTGGELEGSQTINATYTLEGGDWDANSDGATTTISSTGVVNIDPLGEQDPDFDNRDIVNDGTFNWHHGDLDTTAAGSFTNNGTFNDLTDDDNDIGETGGDATFTNNGTFTKSNESETRISQDFDQYGTLEVDAGRLSLADDANFGATSDTQIGTGAILSVAGDVTALADGAVIAGVRDRHF
mgnify:CR=1 FL=1